MVRGRGRSGWRASRPGGLPGLQPPRLPNAPPASRRKHLAMGAVLRGAVVRSARGGGRWGGGGVRVERRKRESNFQLFVRVKRRPAVLHVGARASRWESNIQLFNNANPPRSRSPAGRRSGPVPHGLTETSRVVAEPSLHCLQSLTVGSSRLERSANPEPGRFPPSACPLQGAGADGAARLTLCVRAACGRARCHHRALASPTPGRAGRVEGAPP